MAIEVGDVLGDYEVTGVLGRGGMGKVFRVRSRITDREEAMKVVLPDLAENPALSERFLREIKVHASLQHPNIAALRTALRIGERLVMIVELVDGVSLEELLRAGPLEVPSAVGYTVQVLAALGFAHERGVVHRDIKPANILITADGVAKLTDFGIAQSEGDLRLTRAGLAVGSLAYMSPEQLRAAAVDARSDLYSLGLTLYEAVTGRRAILGDTEHELMQAQLETMPSEPAAWNPQIPTDLSETVMRAMAKEPARRFQNAAEFAAALGRHSGAPAPPNAARALPATELAEMETRLARAIGPIARRLVPDAARRYRTLPEIREALAAQIENPADRQAFLKQGAGAMPTATMPRTRVPAASFDSATLERLTAALAPHLGPIARVVVSRAARTCGSVDELRNALAAEIPDPADRRSFLAAAGS
jgi:eukaryotic-like serine/threonine-protein kinase